MYKFILFIVVKRPVYGTMVLTTTNGWCTVVGGGQRQHRTVFKHHLHPHKWSDRE